MNLKRKTWPGARRRPPGNPEQLHGQESQRECTRLGSGSTRSPAHASGFGGWQETLSPVSKASWASMKSASVPETSAYRGRHPPFPRPCRQNERRAASWNGFSSQIHFKGNRSESQLTLGCAQRLNSVEMRPDFKRNLEMETAPKRAVEASLGEGDTQRTWYISPVVAFPLPWATGLQQPLAGVMSAPGSHSLNTDQLSFIKAKVPASQETSAMGWQQRDDKTECHQQISDV